MPKLEDQLPSYYLPGTLFRLIGYGLVLLMLIESVSSLMPFQIKDTGWQLQTAGGFVDRAPLLLLGLMLVFYGNAELRSKLETNFLNLLSWLALGFGIYYFALVPIFLLTPSELSARGDAQVQEQLTQQLDQIVQFQTRLQRAQGNELESLIKSSNIRSRDPLASNSQELKSKLFQEAEATKKNLRTQAEVTQRGQRLNLLKNSIKWNLGTIVIGVLFLQIWRATRWARQRKKRA